MTPVSREAAEPSRTRPSEAVSQRFSRQRRQATKPEALLRQELHRRGRRFRVQVRVPGLPRRRVDLAFTRWRLIVLVDGCFWHNCTAHGVLPAANREWWTWKLAMNHDRDVDTDERLRSLGWTVIRIWEHVPQEAAADLVEDALVRLGAPARPGAPSRALERSRPDCFDE